MNFSRCRCAACKRKRLPVQVPGAAFCAGHLHAAMGDGEVSGSGVETGGRVRLRQPKAAARSMMALLGERQGIIPSDAFVLLSIAGAVRVNQHCCTSTGEPASDQACAWSFRNPMPGSAVRDQAALAPDV
ncbi:MAG: acetamidase/formamidase family protein [Acetobacteraceae bacterium]|nr:acetamidase/formamidase family protein [Acetobacteraceae bacterium]